mgnify:CR=1 FL=1
MTALLDALRAIVGRDHVLVDADMRAGYEVDWLGQWRGTTPCVVRPGTVEEVADVLRASLDAVAARSPALSGSVGR